MTKILAIETSCDETAISILEFDKTPSVLSTGRVLSHIVSSQVAMHAPYGGVVPNIAKREHQKALIPLLKQALHQIPQGQALGNSKGLALNLEITLEREPELLTQAKDFLSTIGVPDIDMIAVTYGPGLEPALWVGINFAKALASLWQKPLVPVSHMEGHIFSALLTSQGSTLTSNYKGRTFKIQDLEFPALALLISGGHTELLQMKDFSKYELLGQTRDDAVGEAFDKVARLLDLPYPGGPAISKLAERFELNQGSTLESNSQGRTFKLPRPMINSGDLDFSFSGLKTAVRYMIEKLPRPISDEIKSQIAYEFQEAVTDVLITKTKKALEQTGAKSLLVGGGVIANKRIRDSLGGLTSKLEVLLHLPESWLTGDNATMIALATYYRSKDPKNILSINDLPTLTACGTLKLT